MLQIVTGDILASTSDAIAIPVNCKGVMGAGLAKDAKAKWPDRCETYFAACRAQNLFPGGIVTDVRACASPRILIFVATKDDWRKPSRIEWIVRAGKSLAQAIDNYAIASIAVPALGCGKGGLKWNDVQAILRRTCRHAKVPVLLFPPEAHLEGVDSSVRPAG